MRRNAVLCRPGDTRTTRERLSQQASCGSSRLGLAAKASCTHPVQKSRPQKPPRHQPLVFLGLHVLYISDQSTNLYSSFFTQCLTFIFLHLFGMVYNDRVNTLPRGLTVIYLTTAPTYVRQDLATTANKSHSAHSLFW